MKLGVRALPRAAGMAPLPRSFSAMRAAAIPTRQESAMSTKEVSKNEETKSTSVADLDMKLEVVVIPVSDADRAAGDNFRLVQFTPPGSGSSIQFGVNLTSAA